MRFPRSIISTITMPILLILIILFSMPAAYAGRPCNQDRPSTASVIKGLRLAEHTFASLDSSGSDVVLLARAGQDLGKYNIRYSHLGFAYRHKDNNGTSVWRIVHKLNHCGTAESAVYRQGLGEFFLDQPWKYEAAFVPLDGAMQKKLLHVLHDDAMLAILHEKRYSMVSYAWGQKYQQSNQWVIETIALAMADARDRGEAQRWLKGRGYVPQTIRIDALSRLGGRITAANVAFDDHPFGQRVADRIETVTVDSVFGWLGGGTQGVVVVR
jgi:hypothetical protein